MSNTRATGAQEGCRDEQGASKPGEGCTENSPEHAEEIEPQVQEKKSMKSKQEELREIHTHSSTAEAMKIQDQPERHLTGRGGGREPTSVLALKRSVSPSLREPNAHVVSGQTARESRGQVLCLVHADARGHQGCVWSACSPPTPPQPWGSVVSVPVGRRPTRQCDLPEGCIFRSENLLKYTFVGCLGGSVGGAAGSWF